MKKGYLLGCGIVAIGFALCAGVCVLFVGGIFAVTQPVVTASDEFLQFVGEGKNTEAYNSTANAFRARQDEASFTKAVNQLGLNDYSSVFWMNRRILNQEGSTEGTVTTKSGGTKPVSIQLVFEGEKWKVVSLRYDGVDISTIKEAPPIPTEGQQEVMVLEDLLNFNQAVQDKDFTLFYGKLSESWKKQTTAQELQKIFQEFIDKQIAFPGIKRLKPQFDPPAKLNEQGFLVIAGHYPTQPMEVRFELKYIHGSGAWKLQGITVNVGKAKDAQGKAKDEAGE